MRGLSVLLPVMPAGFDEPAKGAVKRAGSKGHAKPESPEPAKRRGLAPTKEESEEEEEEDNPFAARRKTGSQAAARPAARSEIEEASESGSDDVNPFAKRVGPRAARPAAAARKYDDDEDISPLTSGTVSRMGRWSVEVGRGGHVRAGAACDSHGLHHAVYARPGGVCSWRLCSAVHAWLLVSRTCACSSY